MSSQLQNPMASNQQNLALNQHQKLTELIKSERKITEAVLKAILEMDTSKAYLELGYSSLFDYLTKAQKYSESAAQRRISAARLIKELPEVTPQIQAGEINLTQLSKLAIAVKQEERVNGTKVQTHKKKEIIAKLANKSGFETEKVLNEELNYTSEPIEKITPKANEIILTLKLTSAQYEKLERAKNYLSHSQFDEGFAKIIEALCDKLIQKKEGREKSKTESQETQKENSNNMDATVTAATAVEQSPGQTSATEETIVTSKKSAKPKAVRSPIPIHIQRQVFKRANYCCEYQSAITGIKCQNPYQLQVDHRIPLAKGGSDKLENLRALCRGHNLSEAKRWGLDIYPNH